jgi:hypothetical protein
MAEGAPRRRRERRSYLAERLQALLDTAWKLTPNWQDPQKFHETKSELIGDLNALIAEARVVSGALPPKLTERAQQALRRVERGEAASSHNFCRL